MSKGNVRSSVVQIVAIALAVVGVVMYVITSTTGYLAGRAVDPLPVVLSVVAIVALGGDLWLRDRLAPIVRDLVLIGAVVLLAWSFAIFLLARVPLAADVYFIPVNYPEAEETTLNLSLVGIGIYVVALVALIVEAFVAKRRALPAPISLARTV